MLLFAFTLNVSLANYAILMSTLPISMVRIANQVVSVCAWLVNFQPVLIPLPLTDDVEQYFQSCYDTDSEYDADSEQSDEADL